MRRNEAIDRVELIKDWKNINKYIEENFGKNMKFDLIIGNPPYSLVHAADQGYITILDFIYKKANHIVWICPARWGTCSHTKQKNVLEFRKKCKLVSYDLIGNPFEDANVENVGIFEFNDNCTNTINISDIYYTRFKNKEISKNILIKINQYISNNSSMKDIMNNKKNVEIICPMLRGNINNGIKAWDWTTIISNNDANKGFVFGFDTEIEKSNFLKYINLDIIYFTIFASKDDRNNTPYIFSKIPLMNDYTKQWTEEEIANKLGLTKEEVNYIHEEMKPFGWKAQPKNRKKRKSKLDYFANMQE